MQLALYCEYMCIQNVIPKLLHNSEQMSHTDFSFDFMYGYMNCMRHGIEQYIISYVTLYVHYSCLCDDFMKFTCSCGS